MGQITLTFSAQSNAILQHLSQEQQLKLIAFLTDFNFENVEDLGKIVRGQKTYYRIRWNDFRIYFECTSEQTRLVHYLLPKHTWNDFLFRSKLPFNEEMIEKDNRFWQYLEKLKK